MNQPAAAMRQRPSLDEGAFEQLLAAAFVVQEHNDRLRLQQVELRGPALAEGSTDFSQILSEIVAAQTSIQREQLDITTASLLVAERLQVITEAAGAAVGIVENEKLVYCGTAGDVRAEAGSSVSCESSPCAYTLRKGLLLVVRDTENDLRVDSQLCRELRVGALIAVPILHEGKVAGAIELRFTSAGEFREHDLRACQLMAGLITDAMNRAAELKWKQVLAAERATMLAALEKLKPQLERLAGEPAGAEPEPVVPSAEIPKKGEVPAVTCRGCGNPLEDWESFCGACGVARPAAGSGNIQSKWASLWYMQQAAATQARRAETDSEDAEHNQAEDLPPLPSFEELAAEVMSKNPAEPVESTALATVEHQPLSILPALDQEIWHWTSARRARHWLGVLKAKSQTRSFLEEQWKLHKATVYLVMASLLLVFAALGSGGDRDISGRTNNQRQRTAQPQLTTFEKVLVNLGLAVPPPAISTTNMGNPETQVWVDLHTALYYCPGADLYGKTSEGRFAKQREAQLDAFQPASRKACN